MVGKTILYAVLLNPQFVVMTAHVAKWKKSLNSRSHFHNFSFFILSSFISKGPIFIHTVWLTLN